MICIVPYFQAFFTAYILVTVPIYTLRYTDNAWYIQSNHSNDALTCYSFYNYLNKLAVLLTVTLYLKSGFARMCSFLAMYRTFLIGSSI